MKRLSVVVVSLCALLVFAGLLPLAARAVISHRHLPSDIPSSSAGPSTLGSSPQSIAVGADGHVHVTYVAGARGTITGTTSQTIEHGADATEVTAVPDTGQHFVGWSDGVTSAARTDKAVTADLGVTAGFAPDAPSDTSPPSIVLSPTLYDGVTYGVSPLGQPLVFSVIDEGGGSGAFTGGSALVVAPGEPTPVPIPLTWTDNADGARTASGTLPTTVVGAYTLTLSATFATDVFTITKLAGPGGTISGPDTVAYGGAATYAISGDGYHYIADVLVDGLSVGAVTSYTFSNVTADHTISASFAWPDLVFTITKLAGVGGTISGPDTVASGGAAAYAITPDANYHVTEVRVDGLSVGAVTSYTFSNVTADHTISAWFARDAFTITKLAGPGGTISGPDTVASGGAAAYSITPGASYYIADVLVDGLSVGAVSTYTFSNVTADHTISASFATSAFRITKLAGPGGTISGPDTVAYGGAATYAISGDGYHYIADVLVDGLSVGAVTSYTFSNVTADHTISASFAWPDLVFTITKLAGVGGTISGPDTVASGAAAAYAITPDANYHVTEVRVDGLSVGAVTSYTFSNVTADHTISAWFARDAFTITKLAGVGGTITGPDMVASGGDAAYTISPDTNYYIADVRIDGLSVGAVTTYTFSNLTANHTIGATFTRYVRRGGGVREQDGAIIAPGTVVTRTLLYRVAGVATPIVGLGDRRFELTKYPPTRSRKLTFRLLDSAGKPVKSAKPRLCVWDTASGTQRFRARSTFVSLGKGKYAFRWYPRRISWDPGWPDEYRDMLLIVKFFDKKKGTQVSAAVQRDGRGGLVATAGARGASKAKPKTTSAKIKVRW